MIKPLLITSHFSANDASPYHVNTLYQFVPVLILTCIVMAISYKYCKGLKVILPMIVNVYLFGLLIWSDFSEIQNNRLGKIKGVMMVCNLVSAMWMSFHPILEGPTKESTKSYMKFSRYAQLYIFFILTSLKLSS